MRAHLVSSSYLARPLSGATVPKRGSIFVLSCSVIKMVRTRAPVWTRSGQTDTTAARSTPHATCLSVLLQPAFRRPPPAARRPRLRGRKRRV